MKEEGGMKEEGEMKKEREIKEKGVEEGKKGSWKITRWRKSRKFYNLSSSFHLAMMVLYAIFNLLAYNCISS